MNYASLYNMRSCFTVKRARDPRDRVASTSLLRDGLRHRERERERERERNISRINFAIGEFYVRAGFIYYGRAFAATSIHRVSTDRLVLVLASFLFLSTLVDLVELGTNTFVSATHMLNI